MKSKYLVVALSAVALTACNNDEVMEVNQGRGISFQVATEASTRATATTTNSISKFKVWGFTGTPVQTLMNGIEVSKSGTEWSYGDVIFWPETDVDFYSVSPSENIEGTVNITKDAKQITGFTVNADQSKQIDLLYAVNKGENKEDHETTAVHINFRHALSQIIFKAKNTNNNLKVMINDVKVANVVKGGDFTYPESTTPNNTISATTQGTWQLLSGTGSTETFGAGITEKTLNGKTDPAVDLTTVGTDNNYTGALFLMPQELKPWNNLADKTNQNGGSYFMVNCKIYSIASNDEVLLWPSKDEYAYVAIPTRSIIWEQGKKYIYTFIFGEGGGYVPPTDPDPEPGDPEPGDPVLVPISFEVTVDDFQNGNEIDIDMK